MKIGIITFHGAYNYGASLQAYALLHYLLQVGHDAEIIDYYPLWYEKKLNRSFPWNPRVLIAEIDRLFRRFKFWKFNRNFLKVSNRQYRYGETISGYDVVITGSDQVFNPDIINVGGDFDDTYLLTNVSEGTRKIAYAASFGNSDLLPEFAPMFREALSSFEAIGIREESGANIVRNLGLSAISVPDPTILFGDFRKIYAPKQTPLEDYVLSAFFDNSNTACMVQRLVKEEFAVPVRGFINLNQKLRGAEGFVTPSPQEWLKRIYNAKFVITDSFHATVFSILYHRPFIAITLDAWGRDWGERIKNLLDRLGLGNRLLSSPSERIVRELCSTSIDWHIVDKRLEEWKSRGETFLNI